VQKLTPSQQSLALWLFHIKAFQIGSFQLRNGRNQPVSKPSPFYIDLRTPENPKSGGKLKTGDIEQLALALVQAIHTHHLKFQHIAGVPNAGDPLARTFHKKWSLLQPRVELLPLRKPHNIGGKIVALPLPSGVNAHSDVLLIEDVITTGQSQIQAIEALKKMGVTVKNVLAIVDREQGGSLALAKEGSLVYSVFKISSLLQYYVGKDLITRDQYDEVTAYLKVPL
jgi:orotate phosphoribosyltransferase